MNVSSVGGAKMSVLEFLGIFFIAVGCAKLIWYFVEREKG